MSANADDIYADLQARAAQPADAPDIYHDLETHASKSDVKESAPSWTDTNVKRPLGLAARAAVEGVTALPMMAMDAGVGARNLVGNAINQATGQPATPNYEMPSAMLSHSLDTVLPHPKGVRENVIGGIEAGLTGAAVPAPTSGINVPANFKTAAETEKELGQAAIARGQQAGLVVPPSTTNPTTSNKVLESISGKLATQQAASLKNQPVINSLAKQALGLNPDAPLNPDAIRYVKSQASNDYEAIRGAGQITMPQTFKDAIAGTLKKFNSTAEELPSLADKDLQPIAEELTSKDSFSADSLLGAIRALRTKADMAFRAGNGGTGTAFKQMAGHIEDAIQSDLESRGPESADLVGNFVDARRRIAIANTVEDAFNPSTGNVVAPKLAAALKRGAPLSGPLRTIAEFAQSAPNAVREPTSSGVSHLDIGIPAITGLVGKTIPEKVSGFGVPLARAAARKYLLSGMGQAGALPKAAQNATTISGLIRGAPGALSSLSEQPEVQDDER